MVLDDPNVTQGWGDNSGKCLLYKHRDLSLALRFKKIRKLDMMSCDYSPSPWERETGRRIGLLAKYPSQLHELQSNEISGLGWGWGLGAGRTNSWNYVV